MLGEVRSILDFEPHNLFDRFREKSRQSQVIPEFAQAYNRVARSTAPEFLAPDNVQELPYQEIASRLVQNKFPSPELANYALQYGLLIATYKSYDRIDAVFQRVNADYQGRIDSHYDRIRRFAASWKCSMDDAAERMKTHSDITAGAYEAGLRSIAEIEPDHRELKDINKQQKEFAELLSRAMLLMETGFLRKEGNVIGSTLKETLGIQRKKPTLEDMEETRRYMEDYFSQDQNKARIVLLSR